MKPILFPWHCCSSLAEKVAKEIPCEIGRFTQRRFPDGESHVRIQSKCRGREVVVLATLDRPDEKTLPVLLLAETLHDLGAKRVGLLAPYLAYMRQDRRFRPGEGITSGYFARLLSEHFDWLITVDPHLHRISSLSKIYSIPTQVVHAAPYIAEWIRENVEKALIVGPDGESEQWVSEVAKQAKVPYIVLRKIRKGDREVKVSIPDVKKWIAHQPVLVDDIISTARTMTETVGHLRRAEMNPPICVGVHGVFVDDAYKQLIAAGAGSIVTCNTIPHPTNRIDLSQSLAGAVRRQLALKAVRRSRGFR